MVELNGAELPELTQSDLEAGKKTLEIISLLAEADSSESYADTVEKIRPLLEDETEMSALIFCLFQMMVNVTAAANGKSPEELLDVFVQHTTSVPRFKRKAFTKLQEAYYADMRKDETKTLILLTRLYFDLGKRSTAVLKASNHQELTLLSEATFAYIPRLGFTKTALTGRAVKAFGLLAPYEAKTYFAQQERVDENFFPDCLLGLLVNGVQSLVLNAKKSKMSVETMLKPLQESFEVELKKLTL